MAAQNVEWDVPVSIFVRVVVAGRHAWPGANGQAVGFLRHEHRHRFHIEARLAVSQWDREREFFLTAASVVAALARLYGTPDPVAGYWFGAESCEQIAARLGEALGAEAVSVSEDGEHGAEWRTA